MSLINTEKYMEKGIDGEYLNPKYTHGWNEEYLSFVKSNAKNVDLRELINDNEIYADMVSSLNKKKSLNDKLGIIRDELANVYHVEGIGTTLNNLMKDFNKKYSDLLPKLAHGQYENMAALKWSYLIPDPIYNIVYLVNDTHLHKSFYVVVTP